MPTRRGYAAAMRKKNATTTPQSTGPGPVRKAGEAAAKAVYKTLNPAVKATGNAIKSGTVSVLKGYLKGTNALADKIKPYTDKLPNPPKTTPRRRRRMDK